MSKEKKEFKVSVNYELCKACGYCREQCPKGVYDFGTEINSAGYVFMTVVKMEECIGCKTCTQVCPDFALAVTAKV